MNIHIQNFQSGDVTDAAALEQFQQQWATYQKLVDADALSHKAVGGLLQEALNTAFTKPFTFIDIACGDASQMRQALKDTTVRHYHGIDLSEPALELAAKNLEGQPYEVELDHRDFVSALTERPEPADAAWCSLSIHHLQTEKKRSLLEAIRKVTSTFLMIYEPTFQDGGGREGYLERFRRVNRPAWTFLSGDEWAQIDHHVTASDLPETAATWLELGRKAGFSAARQIFLDPTGFYGLYRYDR